jgi:hypothetical protein
VCVDISLEMRVWPWIGARRRRGLRTIAIEMSNMFTVWGGRLATGYYVEHWTAAVEQIK